MKANNLIYILSLIIFAVIIFLIVAYPNSGRNHLIAGILTIVGFTLNIVGYAMKTKK